jgi:hypothetical protein
MQDLKTLIIEQPVEGGVIDVCFVRVHLPSIRCMADANTYSLLVEHVLSMHQAAEKKLKGEVMRWRTCRDGNEVVVEFRRKDWKAEVRKPKKVKSW